VSEIHPEDAKSAEKSAAVAIWTWYSTGSPFGSRAGFHPSVRRVAAALITSAWGMRTGAGGGSLSGVVKEEVPETTSLRAGSWERTRYW
jgi:hypothetical protein